MLLLELAQWVVCCWLARRLWALERRCAATEERVRGTVSVEFFKAWGRSAFAARVKN
jgi:hypothetical protein